MVKFIKSILDFLYPPACPMCDTPVSSHGQLCPACWSQINWIGNPKCVKCGYPFSANLDLGNCPLCPVCAAGQCELDWIRCACVYDDASRSAVLPFKHCGKIASANFMSRQMLSALRDIDVKIDIVMPVPLANRRLFRRGYNQATLLARPIARAFGVRMELDAVVRKYRPDMGHKNFRDRAKNIHGVFTVVAPNKIHGQKILLVDDVMTSGATFSELRRMLVQNGAAAVYGVTFCRVVRAI